MGSLLKYGGVCDCEYPCSCCEFEGKRYSGWDEVIKALIVQRDEAREALKEARATAS